MLWFFDTLVDFPVKHDDGDDGVSVLESVGARGDSPPLHVHRGEDEVFHVLEGELAIRAGDETLRLGAGKTRLAPKGIPHTYLVVSDHARWLVITTRGDFERFVHEASRPAESETVPPRTAAPTQEQMQAIGDLARRHGIELVGPPLREAELPAAA